MNNTLKKFLFILGVVVLTGVVFFGGSIIGRQYSVFKALLSTSTMEKEIANTAIAFMHIRKIDERKIEEAREFINMDLDSHILIIDAYLKDYTNEDDRNRAIKMLASIAKHRHKYPVKFKGNKSLSEYDNVRKKIKQILDSALVETKEN